MRTNIPLLDLSTLHEPLREELLAAITQVVDSNSFIMGTEVSLFEHELAQYCNVRHALGVSSGSDALLVALMALQVKPGDEIITSPFTFFATAGAISRLGAVPVFVDVDPVTLNLDSAKVEEKITSKTKGIIPVHLYGQCAEMVLLQEIAQYHNLFVLEDAAQSIGARDGGKTAGAMGIAGCFSFFPSKNLGAFGDAGAVITNDDNVAEQITILRTHGARPKYHHSFIGGNFRLDTIQAAVLSVKLKHLESWSKARQEAAKRYDELFTDKKLLNDQVLLPQCVTENHVYNQYVIRVKKRDSLRDHLAGQGISTAIYYPIPLHLQNCFHDLGHQPGDFPEAEKAAQEVLAIPIHPALTEEIQEKIVSQVAGFYQAQSRAAA